MKERTFYTINLDFTRIVVLIVILILILAYVFMLGMSFGKKKGSKESDTDSKEISKEIKEKAPIKTEEEMLTPDSNTKTVSTSTEIPMIKEEPVATNVQPSEKDPNLLEKKDPKTNVVTVTPSKTVLPAKQTLPPAKQIQPPAKQGVTPNVNNRPVAMVKQPGVLAPSAKKAIPYYPPAKKTEVKLDSFYTVQLGAFSSQEQAIKYKDGLITTNRALTKYKPYIQKNGDLFVVRLGNSNVKSDLDKIIDVLDPKLKPSAMIVKNK